MVNVQLTQPLCARSAQCHWDRSSTALRANEIVPIDTDSTALLSLRSPNHICALSDSWNWMKHELLHLLRAVSKAGLDLLVQSTQSNLPELLPQTGFLSVKPSEAAPEPAQQLWGSASFASTPELAQPYSRAAHHAVLHLSAVSIQGFCGPSSGIVTEHHADKLYFKPNRASTPPKWSSGNWQWVPYFGGDVTFPLPWWLGVILSLTWKVMTIFRLRSSSIAFA